MNRVKKALPFLVVLSCMCGAAGQDMYDIDLYHENAAGTLWSYGSIAGSTTGGSILFRYTGNEYTYSLLSGGQYPLLFLYSGDSYASVSATASSTAAIDLGGASMAADPYISFTTSGADGKITWDRTTPEFDFIGSINTNNDATVGDVLTVNGTAYLKGSATYIGDTDATDPDLVFQATGTDGSITYNATTDDFEVVGTWDVGIYGLKTSSGDVGSLSGNIYTASGDIMATLGSIHTGGTPGSAMNIRTGGNYESSDGSTGLNGSIVVKGSDGNDCTITVKDGLITAENCP